MWKESEELIIPLIDVAEPIGRDRDDDTAPPCQAGQKS